MNSKFIHLHTHSHYSLLNALPKLPDLIEGAKSDGMEALALTDNGNMYGAIEFYKACKKAEIKPIIGVDFYVALNSRHNKQAGIDNQRTRLVLLAKNNTGYKNLIKLVTNSYLEGFYYRPRIDKELMEKYGEGLICISPQFSGALAQALKNNDEKKALLLAEFYKKAFEDVYLEITHHPEMDGQIELKEKIVTFARKNDLQLVATHDVYYMKPEDHRAREILMAIQGSSGARQSEKNDFSFISQSMAQKYFKDTPDALENTVKIAEMCNVELELGKWVFPNFKIPDAYNYDDFLRKITYGGAKNRKIELNEKTKERIEYELEIIKGKGYSPYFLVVADLLRFAKENEILTNTRGSAAGSMVSYLIGIVNINPMEYNLPFERFLNPERPSAPDIDMDFADNRRDEVIDYARKKYGIDSVAQIGTFGTMAARAAVRDVARAMGYSYNAGDTIAKLIPFGSQGFPMTIDHALEIEPELEKLYKEDADAREIIDMAKKIEGNVRHIGVHAAGVVISPSKTIDYTPTQLDPKGGKTITQYNMHSVEDAGLLKFDFLGIKNLTILADAVKLVKKYYDIDIDLDKIDLSDKKTYDMLARGETVGLFQLSGSGMTAYLKQLRPTEIHDINAMVALYRPGPMAFIPDYIARKHGKQAVKYLDPRLEEYLKPTYGILIYQDDVMLIAVNLAGYSWGEADKFRKAMGKKIPAEMAKQKEKFISGCIDGGMKSGIAMKLWEMIETFAAYGFNKCLTGDTRIMNPNTGALISIYELYKQNKRVVVNSLTDRKKLSKYGITDVMENGIKDVFEIKTKSGKTIKATENHPFLTINGWTNVSKLSETTKVATVRTAPFQTKKNKEELHKAIILGYLLSEGNLCHPYGIYFYSANEAEIKDFIRHAKKFPNTKITINRSKSATSVYIGQENQKVGNTINEWISSLGLKNKKATEKFVPAPVFEFTQKELAVFIGKLWQGDGTINIKNEQIFYATSSKLLAHDLQHLLLRFDILSTIHTKKFKYRGEIKIGYTVVVSHRENIIKFTEKIGKYLIGDKKARCEELFELSIKARNELGNNPARGTKDTIPAEIYAHIRRKMDAKGYTAKIMARKTNLSDRLFIKDKRKKGYQRSTLEKIAKALNSKELLDYSQSDIYWDEIVSIKKTGKEMTYDITVPPYHNFVANDFIVHNSHASSYGNLAFKTSYMKANFPVEYMTAVLTSDAGDTEKIAETIAECKRMNISVLPPDVNESFGDFTVIKKNLDSGRPNDAIRFGLYTIKNFGHDIADAVIEEREKNGKFKSFSDFLERIQHKNLNKKSLEALILCGAMDSFGERGQLFGNMEEALSYHKECCNADTSQASIFGLMDASEYPEFRLKKVEEMSTDTKLKWEKELLGLYISGHPLDKYKEKFEKNKINIKKIKEKMREGFDVVLAGILEDVRIVTTKKGDRMAFIRIADFNDSIEAVVFPKLFVEKKDILTVDNCVALKGKLSKRNDEKSVIVDGIKVLQ